MIYLVRSTFITIYPNPKFNILIKFYCYVLSDASLHQLKKKKKKKSQIVNPFQEGKSLRYYYVINENENLRNEIYDRKRKKKKEKKKKERMQILTETRYRVEGWPVSGTRGAARRSC